MATKLSSSPVQDNEPTIPDTPTQHVGTAIRGPEDLGNKSSAKQNPGTIKPKKPESAAKRPERATTGSTSKNTKADLILKKLRTAKGASIEMLIAETGWQAHSVRGFLSAVVKKKMALNLVGEIGKDGVRRYRIGAAAKSA